MLVGRLWSQDLDKHRLHVTYTNGFERTILFVLYGIFFQQNSLIIISVLISFTLFVQFIYRRIGELSDKLC